MSAPSGFDPTVSLLQQNSTAQIHAFRGGGASVKPFYKALRKAASLEQQNELPEAIEIKNFAISVEDGNFVLTLRIKQKKKAKKASDDDNIKGLARDFLIMEAARQFLIAQKVEGNASASSASSASSGTKTKKNANRNTNRASNVVTAAIATGTVAKAAEAGTVDVDEDENENENEDEGQGEAEASSKKKTRLTTLPSGLIGTITNSSASEKLSRTGSSNPIVTSGAPTPIRRGSRVTTLGP